MISVSFGVHGVWAFGKADAAKSTPEYPPLGNSRTTVTVCSGPLPTIYLF